MHKRRSNGANVSQALFIYRSSSPLLPLERRHKCFFFFLIIIIPLCQTFPAPFFEKNMKSKIVGWGWGRFSSMFIALNRKTSAVLRKKTPFLLLGASYYQC